MQDIIRRFDSNKYKVLSEVKRWHLNDRRVFSPVPIEEEFCNDQMALMMLKNAYHNYQMWHLIEDYKQDDLQKSLFFFNGGKEHNTYRNETINALDNYFDKYQSECKDGTPSNSESIGSIIDRTNIAHIKFLHLNEAKPEAAQNILEERKHLDWCSTVLLTEMVAGKRRYKCFTKFKIQYCDMDKNAQNISL